MLGDDQEGRMRLVKALDGADFLRRLERILFTSIQNDETFGLRRGRF